MRLSRTIRRAARFYLAAFHSMAIDLQLLKHRTGEITLKFNNRDNSHERGGIQMTDEGSKSATSKFTTTTAGVPVASDEHSRTVGPDGAVVLHDVYLVEKLAQFNRARVPECFVHARAVAPSVP